jgi:YggT family protein
MSNVLFVFDLVLESYIWILLAAAVVSWLIGFKVVSTDNRAVAVVDKLLNSLTEPVRRPMRYLLPDLGGVDISPLLLIALVMAVRYGMVFFSAGRSTVAF